MLLTSSKLIKNKKDIQKVKKTAQICGFFNAYVCVRALMCCILLKIILIIQIIIFDTIRKYVPEKGINKMKFKKGLSALGLLLALTTVACGGTGSSAAEGSAKGSSQPAISSSSALPSIKVTAADNKKTLEVEETVQLSADVEGITWESSNTAVATVDATGKVTAVAAGTAKISAKKDGYKAGDITITVNKPANPLLTPLVRNYTEGQAEQNTAGKEYIPLNDATAGKVGVKISIQNWEVPTFEGVTAESVLASDGGIEPKNDHNAFIGFRIKAPKAGNYQLVVTGKGSSSGDGKTLNDRAFAVKVNGEDVEIEGDREPINSTAHTAFVAAPTIALRGTEEDVVAISCSDYRIKFDTTSFVLFNEI